MIGVVTTAALIVGCAALLTQQAHRRRLRAEAEARTLEARDRRRQAWIDDAGQVIWRLADRGEALDPRAMKLLSELQHAAHLKPLQTAGAAHQGAVRIAEARLDCGMEVTG